MPARRLETECTNGHGVCRVCQCTGAASFAGAGVPTRRAGWGRTGEGAYSTLQTAVSTPTAHEGHLA